MTVIAHVATYEFDANQVKLWRVKCTCGWMHTGSLTDCETKFSGHDLGKYHLGKWVKLGDLPIYQQLLNQLKHR